LPADDIDRALVRDRLASAVREAGALALHMFRGRPASWIKGASSPVSEADLAVDALLRERLLAIRDAGWLSEETEDDPARLQRAEVWVVDPIDGTRAYLAGLAEWVIAAALVRFGRPLVAALYAPVSDELFLSVAGGGATLNGAPIKASAGDQLAGATFSGAKRRLDSLAAVEPRDRAENSLARLAACARCHRRARWHLCCPQQPRLGPCGSRSFGARSRRAGHEFDGRIVDLQSARSGSWRAGGCRPRPSRVVARPHSRSAGGVCVIEPARSA
jgi:fructose-1,6-bisphosphatase/inositol monophosphatase family enzyme